MTGILQTARTALQAAISAYQSDPGFTLNDFTLSSLAIPGRRAVKDIVEKPYVSLLGKAVDEQRLTRSAASTTEIIVESNIQYKIPTTPTTGGPLDPAVVDQLNAFLEEIGDVAKGVSFAYRGSLFAWNRNEAPREPQGTPYSYEIFREESVYQGTYLHVFQGTKPPLPGA